MKVRPQRILFYLFGMSILALGLTLSTRADLGVSPIITVSFAASQLSGLRMGDTTLILYVLMIAAQLLLLLLPGGKRRPASRKRALLLTLLQLPLSLAFTQLMNLFSAVFPAPSAMPSRLLTMLFSMVLVGCGAAMTLNMRLVPNPGDGIVQAISDRSGLELGLTKNIVDAGCVALTACICLLAHRLMAIGIGTVIAMLGVGRIISLFNRLFGARLCKAAGIAGPSSNRG